MKNKVSLNTALFVLSTTYFIQSVASLSVVGLLVPMSDGLGVTKSEIAYLLSAFSIANAIASPGMQILAGDWDRRRLMIFGLLAVACGTAMTGLAGQYQVAVLGRVIMAIGAGVAAPMASATGAALVPPEQRGIALGKVFAGMTIATVLGVPLTALGGDWIGWRMTLLIVAFIAVVVAVVVHFVVPETEPGRRAKFSDVWSILSDRVIGPAISVTGFQMAAQFATYSVIAAYLIEKMNMSSDWLPLILMLFGVGGIVGNILSTRLVARTGPERLMLWSLVTSGIIFLALQYAPPIPWVVFVLMGAWAISGMMLFAPQQTRVIGMYPAMANLLLALNGTAIYIGMSVGAAISGVLFATSGTDWLALASAGLIVLAIGAFWISMVPRKAQLN